MEPGEELGCGSPGMQNTGPPGITHGRRDGPGSVDGFASSSVETGEFGSLGMMEDVQFALVCAEPSMEFSHGRRGEKVHDFHCVLKNHSILKKLTVNALSRNQSSLGELKTCHTVSQPPAGHGPLG